MMRTLVNPLNVGTAYIFPLYFRNLHLALEIDKSQKDFDFEIHNGSRIVANGIVRADDHMTAIADLILIFDEDFDMNISQCQITIHTKEMTVVNQIKIVQPAKPLTDMSFSSHKFKPKHTSRKQQEPSKSFAQVLEETIKEDK